MTDDTIVLRNVKIFAEKSLPARFHALFAGREDAHGAYNNISLDETRTDGKQKGDAVSLRAPVTDELWQRHLNGQSGIGIVPIRPDNTSMFGAIDIDVYDLSYAAILAQLAKFCLPLILCRSKSGGAHLFLFAKEPVPATDMQRRLQEIAARLGYGTCEVFPKQTSIQVEEKGSWINMPYFAYEATTRFALNDAGDACSAEEFLELAESRKVDATWFTFDGSPCKAQKTAAKKTFSIPDEIGEGLRDNTLASVAGKMRRAGLTTDEILATLRQVNQDRCKPPLPDRDVERIAKSIGRKEPAPVDEDEGMTKALATAITASDHFARDKGTMLYRFEGGVYKPTGQRFIERIVKELCQAWEKTKAWSPELATRVGEWLLADAPELWECPPLDVLNCKNGLLDVASRTLRNHSPEHLSPVQIPVSFDPGAQCPHIDRFVKDVFPDDTQQLPFEVAGWLMLPDTSIQKAVLTLGEGANGKSVWLNMLMNFLGRENVSTLSLHRIESDKFAAARLLGKLCNLGTDLPTAALAGTSMFKALTGGDSITAERKYESSFEFRPFARLLFSANSAPRSDDPSHGFFRRWIVIPFTRTFDETDPNTVPAPILNARLSEPGELSGMLNRALDALPVIRQGRFTESASTRAAWDEFRRTTDPLAVWLEQNTVERSDATIPKDRLRNAYAQVCQDAGRPILPDTQFTAALKRLRPRVQPAQRRVDGRNTKVFVGLGFVTQDPVPGGSGLF